MTFRDQLIKLGARDDALEWVGSRTLERAWGRCERSDWMLWLLRALGIDARECAGHFALRVWHLVPAESQLACAWAIDCATRGADDEETAAAAYAAVAARAARAARVAEQRDRFAAMVNVAFAAIGENDA